MIWLLNHIEVYWKKAFYIFLIISFLTVMYPRCTKIRSNTLNVTTLLGFFMNHKYIASYSFQKKYTQMSSYQKGFKFEVPTTYTKDKVLLLLSFNPLSPLDFSSVRVEHQTYNNSSQIIKHALPSAILPNNKNET